MKSVPAIVRHTAAAFCLGLVPVICGAAEYLFYFDVSGSAQPDQKVYLAEFDRFAGQRLLPGDRASVLLLNAETNNFSPVVRKEFQAPSGGVSEKKKKELLESARSGLVVDTATILKRTTGSNSTNILGALVSAADHFRQERVPANQRVMVIFTDGLEASALSGVNMEKQIPAKAPAKFVLPPDLQAEIHMIGIKPPAKASAQETMRRFWEDTISRTGSKLSRYIRAS